MTARSVLLVAGEPSGDRLAAELVRHRDDLSFFGVGGFRCQAAGMACSLRSEDLGAMGLFDVARVAGPLLRSWGAFRDALRKRPAAAVLVGFTELNLRLGHMAKDHGVPVLWCAAPQVWAWRRGRTATLHRSVDVLAALFPFECPLFERHGVRCMAVGHPAVDAAERARRRTPKARDIHLAVAPGSRRGEVSRLSQILCDAAVTLRADRIVDRVTVLVASDLPAGIKAELVHRCESVGLRPAHVDDRGPYDLLASAHATLCASGTVALEAALCGAPPVVAYRMDPLAFALAKAAIRLPFIALPNVLLGRSVYPECLGRDASVAEIARSARSVLARAASFERARERLLSRLGHPHHEPFGHRLSACLDETMRLAGRD